MPRPPRSTLLVLTLVGCGLFVPPAVEEPAPKSLDLVSTEWPPFTAVEGEPRVANELVAMALRGDGI